MIISIKKLALLCLALFFGMHISYAQDFFVKNVTHDSTTIWDYIFPRQLAVNSSNELEFVIQAHDHTFHHPKTISLSPQGEITNTTEFNILNGTLYGAYSLDKNDDYIVFNSGAVAVQDGIDISRVLFGHNTATNTTWAKRILKNTNTVLGYTANSITQHNNIISSARTDTSHANVDPYVFSLNAEDGSLNWAYRFFAPSLGYFNYPTSAVEDNDHQTFILFFSNSSSTSFSPRMHLLKMTNQHQAIKSVELNFPEDHSVHHSRTGIDIDNEGNIYTATQIRDTINNIHSSLLIKLNNNLQLVWSKKVTGESFPPQYTKLKVTADGNITLVAGYGSYYGHSIAAKLSSEGELLASKGFDFPSRQSVIGDDGSIFFTKANVDFPFAHFVTNTILVKTLPNLSIPSCPQFDACLMLEDFEITTTVRAPSQFPMSGPTDVNVYTTNHEVSIEDYCAPVSIPEVGFAIADTICQYECATTTDLNNALAHSTVWHIQGPQTDTTIIDTIMTYCFEHPGAYLVEQEMWFFGCQEYWAQQITVLPDNFDLDLGEDLTLCDAPPFTLTPQTNRDPDTFEWNTGESTPSIFIDSSGTYSLVVSDGFCTDFEIVDVYFVQEDVERPYFILPNDTTICPDFLPYSFAPINLHTDTTYYQGQILDTDSIIINQGGLHNFQILVDGCWFEEQFSMTVKPCEIDVFIPSAFSPNDDGINDFLTPLGVDFDGVSLQVFDRWGGLLFNTDNPPYHWDGFSNTNKADAGVYIVVFTYFNKRNLTTSTISRDVTLVR